MVADVYLLMKFAKAGPSLAIDESSHPSPEKEMTIIGNEN